jgi:uncharacterized protein YjiS (DUF1127 family)
MASFITRLRAAAAKRAAYNQTVREISRLPREVAWDIGIFREDAEQIAWKHVYGR